MVMETQNFVEDRLVGAEGAAQHVGVEGRGRLPRAGHGGGAGELQRQSVRIVRGYLGSLELTWFQRAPVFAKLVMSIRLISKISLIK